MELLLVILILCSALIHQTFGQGNNASANNYYYSNTTTEATNLFTLACQSANGSIEYFTHPMKGLYNESLRAAVCAVGKSSARSVVFTTSGTHGIEGYAGSMAQISMLRGPPSMFPADVRMVHLHMINPYGASYITKENDINADQLKNYAGYYKINYTNVIVEELMDGIDLPNLRNETVMNNAMMHYQQVVIKYGPTRVAEALSMGQGTRPQGIAYFGSMKSWSSNTTDYVVNKYLPNATQVLVIDWHTAVGPYGNWTFLPVDAESESAFKRWAPDALVGVYDIGVPPGGSFPYSHIKSVANARRVIRGFWEAGTYPTDNSINAAFILRLYCRFYGNQTDPFCQNITSQIHNYFYPQAADWKPLTYNAINDILPKVLAGFAAEGGAAIHSIHPWALIVFACIHLFISNTL